MMNEAKPFASLGPTLLARKGGARPAMRPQLSPLLAGAQTVLDADGEELDDLERSAEEAKAATYVCERGSARLVPA